MTSRSDSSIARYVLGGIMALSLMVMFLAVHDGPVLLRVTAVALLATVPLLAGPARLLPADADTRTTVMRFAGALLLAATAQFYEWPDALASRLHLGTPASIALHVAELALLACGAWLVYGRRRVGGQERGEHPTTA